MIALGVAALTYLALNVTSRKKFMSVLIIVLLFVGIAVGVYRVGFFDWSKVGSKQGSNEIRYEKIVKTWDTYLSSPVLGIGYGAVGALDSKRVADSLATDVKASAEFTPLQILAETGTLGGVFSVWLLVFAGRRLLWALRSPGLPRYAQILLYTWIVVFISDFLGSNSYSSLIYMLMFPVAAYEVWVPTFDAASNRPLQ